MGPLAHARGSETQCADTEPRPKGAECVTQNWLKSISPRIAQLRGRHRDSETHLGAARYRRIAFPSRARQQAVSTSNEDDEVSGKSRPSSLEVRATQNSSRLE